MSWLGLAGCEFGGVGKIGPIEDDDDDEERDDDEDKDELEEDREVVDEKLDNVWV